MTGGGGEKDIVRTPAELSLVGETASGLDAGILQWAHASGKLGDLDTEHWSKTSRTLKPPVVAGAIRKPAFARQTWMALQESRHLHGCLRGQGTVKSHPPVGLGGERGWFQGVLVWDKKGKRGARRQCAIT